MHKVILGVLLATAILALMPTPTKVITVSPAGSGSIVTTTIVPTGSHQFQDDKEVLFSIITGSWTAFLC